MIPDFSGDFISAKSVKDGDIGEIMSEGSMEYSEALKKDMFNIKVKLNEKVKTWTPSNEHGKLLQKSFGLDSKEWIGKKIQFLLVQDKMLIKPLI